jgi:hypothetical protein
MHMTGMVEYVLFVLLFCSLDSTYCISFKTVAMAIASERTMDHSKSYFVVRRVFMDMDDDDVAHR